MEYVKGMSITRYCDEHRLNIEQRLRLFEQVCEGVQHAHQKGIIHRDLKPSNILVSVHGDRAVPKIIDFGIAKAITQPLTEKTFVTFQGQLLGTPEYMSPEQVDLATQDIDTRSDIYSLGVVLYELLAGVLPFEEESFAQAGLAEIQRTIREQEPASPSIRLTSLGERAKTIAASRGTQVVPLARRLHRELEWIPLKAMRKDRCRRYRSASEMADDIHNYLTGRPLIAGPETAIYRVQKFVRKHAGSVATVVLVVAAIVLGLIVSTAMYFRAERMRIQADQARQKEVIARTEAEQATKKETAARADAEQAKEKETVARTQAEQAEQATKQKDEELRHTLYVNSIQLADAKHREGNASQARTLLDSCPEDLRGWEWDRINHTLDQSAMSIATGQEGIVSLALSPDGKRVVSSGWDMTIKVWDMVEGNELVTIKVGDKNAYIQTLYHGDLDGWRQARSNLAWCIAFSPDGKHIASGHESGEIKIWDAATGRQLKTLEGHKNPIDSVAFSSDGKCMASRAYEIKLWDTSNWTELMSLHDRASTGMDSCVTFSPDGKRIASTGGEDDQIKVWDTVTGQGIWSIWGHDYYAYSVSFSADGKFLASGGDNEIKIWDAATGSNVMTLRGQDASVCSVAFSPDGKYVASGSHDNTIRVWDITTRETMMTLRGHEHVVWGVIFTPDGKRLVSHSWDGNIKIWDMCSTRESTKLVRHKTPVGSLAFNPDGKRVVSVDAISVKLWDVESAAESKTLYKGRRYMRSAIAFSPDGKRIALHDFSGTFKIWDAATGNEITTFRGPKPLSRIGVELAFSPDGKFIASSGGADKTVKVWDATRGEEVATLKGRASLVCSVAFSPDGKFIVAGGHDPDIKVWEWATGHESMTLRGHDKGTIRSVSFSPDGKRIVSASHQDHTVKLWDATTGAELMTLKHADSVTSAAFSPDGKRIVSGCLDGAARVWDATTGAELLALRAGFSVLDVAFSPDGKTVAGGLLDHTIALWESAPPPGGYDQRKIGVAARRIVDELHEKHGSYNEVISQLQHDVTSDAAIRKLAMQIASSNKWGDAEKLEHKAWEVIVAPDKDVKVYETALEEAGKANALEPNDSGILTMLGAAQYRLGSHEDALKTLAKAAQVLSDAGEEADPANVAFKAMTLYKIGRAGEAKNALEQLRKLCKNEQFAEDMDVQGLLAEAEKLISGDQQ